MTDLLYVDLLDLGTGAVLVGALIVLWRRDLRAMISALGFQGIALGAVAATLAEHTRDVGLAVVAGVVLVVKGVVVPTLLRTVAHRDPSTQESAPLVNVPASLVAAAALIILAYLASGQIVALANTSATRLVPIAPATVLVGFLVLVTRRKASSQIVGLLLIDNGVALAAFLLTAGVPLLVELGASLDLLLVVAVLRVLAATMHAGRGPFDLDELRQLRELRD